MVHRAPLEWKQTLFSLNEGASSGPTHKRTEGRAPVWGFEFTTKAATLQGGAQAIVRSGARCTSQVLDHGAQAVARGAARCALHVHGRSARTDACGRSFAVLL
jgi:hypothetical protein